MLRVTVELVPYGDELRSEIIGRMVIGNTCLHPKRPEYGGYVVKIKDNDEFSELEVFDHKRSDGFWKLLLKILEQHCGDTRQGATLIKCAKCGFMHELMGGCVEVKDE